MTTQTLDYRHGDTACRGHLVLPQASGARPGIVIFHEAPGLNDNVKRRAAMLAELGYVALGADMYGGGTVAKDGDEAMRLMGGLREDTPLLRARARAALDALAARPEVDRGRLAAIGYCFGGFTALELARSGAPLAGVVSFHGLLGTQQPAKPGAIKGKILACTGAADPLVPADQVVAFQREMSEAGVDWQVVAYGGAQHGFTNPAADALNRPGFGYQEAADLRSWAAMRTFFGEIFGEA
ncbi:MAG TPA: dienelactone hydrolase family protein [Alphaproteobacteria bacterium]